MCGLIGFTGPKRPDLFKLGHIMADNDSRGGHSTGIFINNQLEKTTGKSANLLLKLGDYQSSNSAIAIAHTRYATHGKQTAENAHPYKYGKIIGAHNGVLDNYEEVCDKFNIKKPDVDSKAIFSMLNKTKNYKNLGLFGGTIAVLFTDNKDTLYVYRRNNPLYKCVTDEGIYFSSKKESFEGIGMKITEVKPNKLFKYVNGELKSTIKIKHKPVPTTRIVNTDWSSYGGYTNYGTKDFTTGWKGYAKSTTTKSSPVVDTYNYWYDDPKDNSPVDCSEAREVIEDINWAYRNHFTPREETVIDVVKAFLNTPEALQAWDDSIEREEQEEEQKEATTPKIDTTDINKKDELPF
jgi:glucosamine--fructose-6-phosphate aminotransferase (isomerizing)